MTDNRKRSEAAEAARYNLERLLPSGQPHLFWDDDFDSGGASENALLAINDQWSGSALFKSFPMDFRWVVGNETGMTAEGTETVVIRGDVYAAKAKALGEIREAVIAMLAEGEPVVCLAGTENERYLAERDRLREEEST